MAAPAPRRVRLVPRIHITYTFLDEPGEQHIIRITPRTVCEFETHFDVAYDQVWMGQGRTTHFMWMVWKQAYERIEDAKFQESIDEMWLVDANQALTGVMTVDDDDETDEPDEDAFEGEDDDPLAQTESQSSSVN